MNILFTIELIWKTFGEDHDTYLYKKNLGAKYELWTLGGHNRGLKFYMGTYRNFSKNLLKNIKGIVF